MIIGRRCPCKLHVVPAGCNTASQMVSTEEETQKETAIYKKSVYTLFEEIEKKKTPSFFDSQGAFDGLIYCKQESSFSNESLLIE